MTASDGRYGESVFLARDAVRPVRIRTDSRDHNNREM